jgi:hypothetical protein
MNKIAAKVIYFASYVAALAVAWQAVRSELMGGMSIEIP